MFLSFQYYNPKKFTIQYHQNILTKKSQIKMQQEQTIHRLSNTVQSSSQIWPNDQKFRDQLSLPLTLTLHPLEHIDADIGASFSGGRVNDYRCQSCKAFVNRLCVIRSKYQYDCSICGCTNRSKVELNSLAAQFRLPVFTCTTKNPSFQHIQDNVRTFVFAIDVSSYMEQTKTIVHYVVETIKELLKNIKEENEKARAANRETCKLRFIIMGFNDYISLYRVVTTKDISKQTIEQQKIHDGSHPDQPDYQFQKDEVYVQQDVEIDKVIDTHLGMSHEDLVNQKTKYFIDVPKYTQQIEEILVDLMNSVKEGKERSNSGALLPVIQRIMNYTTTCMGKVFIVTGFRNSKGHFVSAIEQEPEQFKQNFSLNRQKCLPESLVYLLQRTQMSISIFIYNSKFVNLLPLYVITKMTNGQLKHYNPHNFHQFYYQFQYVVCTQSFQLGTETVLKVRHSNGIKLIGIFGQHRPYKGAKDQVQLLSCSPYRSYMFQFIVQGKIIQPYINIQFSILWTDAQGNRMFKIVTHSQKLSNNRTAILQSVNYGVVNQSYLWAVLHNMDSNVKVKNLQITLQERCRKHLQALEKYKESKDTDCIKKSTPYIIFSYYLISHFILNTRFDSQRVYDKAIETRSRIITNDVSGIYAIWPVVYSVSKNKIKVVELKYSQIKDSEVAVVIDQADFTYVFVVDQEQRRLITNKKIQENRLLSQIIGEIKQLEPLAGILKQIREEKPCGYTEIILLDNLQGAYVLDQKGPKGYQNFVSNLVS